MSFHFMVINNLIIIKIANIDIDIDIDIDNH